MQDIKDRQEHALREKLEAKKLMKERYCFIVFYIVLAYIG